MKLNGYWHVCLHKNKQQKTVRVHRLVANEFIENPQNKPQVNHKNGNKKDNRIENLEWATSSENINHAVKTGLKPNTTENQRNVARKNGLKCRKRVLQYDKNKTYSKVWKGIKEASRKTGIDKSSIVKCCKGKVKSAGGYMWKYIESRE